MSDELQDFWDNILSAEPEKIINTYRILDANEQQYVIVHLYKMINEPGWHSSQVSAAQVAISTIEEIK